MKVTNSSKPSFQLLTEIAQPPTPQIEPEKIISFIKSPNGTMLIVVAILFSIIQLFAGDNKKGKIATSYWGGTKEKNAAKKKATKQIKSPQRNSAALYIGMPPDIRKKLNADWFAKQLIPEKDAKKKPPASPTLYLPDVQRGTAVIGAAGSGKTFSVIDPMVRSALDQGFPMCMYDFKYPAQTKRAVAYALKRGYTVRLFAPGFPESDTCNPLDLIKNEEDAIAAGQLAQVINRNIGGARGGDSFFEDAGDALTEGIFLLTKAIETLTGERQYCDLIMAQAILSLTSLPARLEAALPRLNVWTTRPLTQLISVKDSEKTAASIVGTAQKTFQRFLKKDFVGAFCGQTTLPLDIDGKQLIIFGLDRNNRDIVSPLLAAILHMVVTRNVSRTTPRHDPLITVLDELPTLYLPQLVNWLNENREDGFCGILGFQNISQLEHKYGKEIARAVIGGCATKFIFNPQDPESAKIFADLLGETEIEYKSKSKSSSQSGTTTSISDQKQKRHLMEAAAFGKLTTGRAIILNPAYQRQDESYIPLLQHIKVSKADIAEQKWAENQWTPIRERFIKANNALVSDTERSRQLEERRNLAEQLFPLPEGEADNSSNNVSDFF